MMGKKHFIVLFAFLVSAALCWNFLPLFTRGDLSSKALFTSLKIDGFSSAGIPLCTLRIENETIRVKVDLGYEGSLSLPSEFLDKIQNKKFLKTSLASGINGKIYQEKVYQIGKVSLAAVDFTPNTVTAYHPELERQMMLYEKQGAIEQMGRVGWKLFNGSNLLIDCKNQQLVICDTIETVRAKGYLVDSCTQTSFSIKNGVIEFEAITDTGPVLCMLDTGSTWNFRNQYEVAQKNKVLSFDIKDVFDTTLFRVGGTNFGPITFNRIYSPMPFQAIIGMEFFNDTLVFLDFEHKLIYFCPS